MNIYLLISIFFIAVPFLYLYAKVAIKNSFKNSLPYKSKNLLTDNELEFFWRLTRALPDTFIFPQVAMSALIEPTVANNSKTYLTSFNKIAQKRVDYAIFDTGMKLLCIVELDDKTHNASKDKARDKLFSVANIRTIRWNSKNKPDQTEIQTQVFPPQKIDNFKN